MQDNNDIANKSIEHMQDNNDTTKNNIEHMQKKDDTTKKNENMQESIGIMQENKSSFMFLPTCQDQRPNVNGYDWCIDYQPVKTSAPM